MFRAQHAAVSLALVVLFVPFIAVHAVGDDADDMCPYIQNKSTEEYNAQKPPGKRNETRNGTIVTITNYYGKECIDVTNEIVTRGTCVAEHKCEAKTTAEGDKPARPSGEQLTNCVGGPCAPTSEKPSTSPLPKPNTSGGSLLDQALLDPTPISEQPTPLTSSGQNVTQQLQEASKSSGWFDRIESGIQRIFSPEPEASAQTPSFQGGTIQSITPTQVPIESVSGQNPGYIGGLSPHSFGEYQQFDPGIESGFQEPSGSIVAQQPPENSWWGNIRSTAASAWESVTDTAKSVGTSVSTLFGGSTSEPPPENLSNPMAGAPSYTVERGNMSALEWKDTKDLVARNAGVIGDTASPIIVEGQNSMTILRGEEYGLRDGTVVRVGGNGNYDESALWPNEQSVARRVEGALLSADTSTPAGAALRDVFSNNAELRSDVSSFIARDYINTPLSDRVIDAWTSDPRLTAGASAPVPSTPQETPIEIVSARDIPNLPPFPQSQQTPLPPQIEIDPTAAHPVIPVQSKPLDPVPAPIEPQPRVEVTRSDLPAPVWKPSPQTGGVALSPEAPASTQQPSVSPRTGSVALSPEAPYVPAPVWNPSPPAPQTGGVALSPETPTVSPPAPNISQVPLSPETPFAPAQQGGTRQSPQTGGVALSPEAPPSIPQPSGSPQTGGVALSPETPPSTGQTPAAPGGLAGGAGALTPVDGSSGPPAQGLVSDAIKSALSQQVPWTVPTFGADDVPTLAGNAGNNGAPQAPSPSQQPGTAEEGAGECFIVSSADSNTVIPCTIVQKAPAGNGTPAKLPSALQELVAIANPGRCGGSACSDERAFAPSAGAPGRGPAPVAEPNPALGPFPQAKSVPTQIDGETVTAVPVDASGPSPIADPRIAAEIDAPVGTAKPLTESDFQKAAAQDAEAEQERLVEGAVRIDGYNYNCTDMACWGRQQYESVKTAVQNPADAFKNFFGVATAEAANLPKHDPSRRQDPQAMQELRNAAHIVCKAYECDGSTYARALAGSCTQESQCNPTMGHQYRHVKRVRQPNGKYKNVVYYTQSQYQGLGQLSRTSTEAAYNNLIKVRDSSKTTMIEKEKIERILQRTRAWIDNVPGAADPRFSTEDGAWLFAARAMEMGAAEGYARPFYPIKNIQNAAPGDALTQGYLIQLTSQLAPAANIGGLDLDKPLSPSIRGAFSNNGLRGVSTLREAVAVMSKKSSYGTNIPSGVAAMERLENGGAPTQWAQGPVPVPQPNPLRMASASADAPTPAVSSVTTAMSYTSFAPDGPVNPVAWATFVREPLPPQTSGSLTDESGFVASPEGPIVATAPGLPQGMTSVPQMPPHGGEAPLPGEYLALQGQPAPNFIPQIPPIEGQPLAPVEVAELPPVAPGLPSDNVLALQAPQPGTDAPRVSDYLRASGAGINFVPNLPPLEAHPVTGVEVSDIEQPNPVIPVATSELPPIAPGLPEGMTSVPQMPALGTEAPNVMFDQPGFAREAPPPPGIPQSLFSQAAPELGFSGPTPTDYLGAAGIDTSNVSFTPEAPETLINRMAAAGRDALGDVFDPVAESFRTLADGERLASAVDSWISPEPTAGSFTDERGLIDMSRDTSGSFTDEQGFIDASRDTSGSFTDEQGFVDGSRDRSGSFTDELGFIPGVGERSATFDERFQGSRWETAVSFTDEQGFIDATRAESGVPGEPARGTGMGEGKQEPTVGERISNFFDSVKNGLQERITQTQIPLPESANRTGEAITAQIQREAGTTVPISPTLPNELTAPSPSTGELSKDTALPQAPSSPQGESKGIGDRIASSLSDAYTKALKSVGDAWKARSLPSFSSSPAPLSTDEQGFIAAFPETQTPSLSPTDEQGFIDAFKEQQAPQRQQPPPTSPPPPPQTPQTPQPQPQPQQQTPQSQTSPGVLRGLANFFSGLSGSLMKMLGQEQQRPPAQQQPQPKPPEATLRLSITANPVQIGVGSSSVVSWSSVGASRCSVRSSSGDTLATSTAGSRTVILATSTVFTADCSGAQGLATSSSVRINVK